MQLFNRLKPTQKVAISFLSVILIGSLLLSLPISQLPSAQANYLDHLFMATSSVCVTGLWNQSIHDTYSLFGQIVVLILIQTGGLGLMTIIGTIYHSLGQPIQLRNQIATGDAINLPSRSNLGTVLNRIIKYTLIIELIGALCLSAFFVPQFGWKKGLFNSIFTAISAFCNAGFDLLGNSSFIDYQSVPILNWTLIVLIILGGIGFGVWFDVVEQYQKYRSDGTNRPIRFYIKHLRTHTKLVVSMYFFIIVIGTILFLMVEWNNPGTIGHLSISDKIMTSIFQTVTMRTAGFATVDYSLAHPISLLIFTITMFIGGGAGGTAGGLKVSTFALILLMVKREIDQSEYITFDRHTIPLETVRTALVIGLAYVGLLIIGSGLLLTFEPQINFIALLFEATSALATVGVSASLTPSLSSPSHLTLIALMYIGRIGPMTMLLSLRKPRRKSLDLEYTYTNIIVG